MKQKSILFLTLILCSASARGQWSAGISAGWDYNWPSVTKGYATDVTYTGQPGFDISAMGKYTITDWFAVRADLRLDTRSYKMDRHYELISTVNTNHRDTYLHLPIVAEFSFGGEKLRGHCYLGGYLGYWLTAHRDGISIQQDTESSLIAVTDFDERMDFDSRRDRRFNAGLSGGLGISYLITPKWEVLAEALYMYDLTSSEKTYMLANPRYNSTMCINVGVMYNF